MFKRISALFIVVIMALTVSCAGEPAELLEFINSNASGDLDCEGKTFTFASSWYFEWYAFEDDDLPTVAVERMMKRFHSIEDKFNAEFEMVKMTEDEVLMLLITGEDIPEMFDTTAEVAYNLYKSKVLASLNQLDAIDMNDIKWGEHNFIQYGNFNGEQYGFYPWHWEFIPQFEGATIFNAENIARFGATHPYELQENGNWNWDSFEAELKKTTVMENDTQYYGAIISYDEIAKAAIFSNGGQIIDGSNEDGYEFGLKSDKSIQALDWLNSLNSAGYFHDGSLEDFSKQQLSSDLVGPSYYGTNFNPNSDTADEYISTNLNDYGFITFPTGPQGDEYDVGAYTYLHRRLNYISNLSDIEAENSAKIVNYIFDPLDGSGEEGWKEYAQNMIFTTNNNQACMDNFSFIMEQMGYDYSVQMSRSAYDQLNSTFKTVINGTKSASEAISAVEEIVMSNFNK